MSLDRQNYIVSFKTKDGEVVKVGKIRTCEELEITPKKGYYHIQDKLKYQRQYRDFEESILNLIDENILENYAENYTELMREDDFECDCENKELYDFEDDEIEMEFFDRNSIGIQTYNISIIQADFIKRIFRIMAKKTNLEMEVLLTKIEAEIK